MIDVDVVLRKLTSLRDHVARLRRRRSEHVAAFIADLDRQDAVGMSLLVATQEAVDIALHMAADEGWGIPASYAESFDLLERNHVIDADLARRLAAIAGLRNRIAHGYASVDAARVWTELPDGMEALERFAASVATHIGRK